MDTWVTVCLMMWAAGRQSADANKQAGFVTCEIPAVKVGETATLTCRFPGNVNLRQISVQKYRRGSRGVTFLSGKLCNIKEIECNAVQRIQLDSKKGYYYYTENFKTDTIEAPIPILDCNSLDREPDCRHHDWRSIFDQDTMIREHEVIVKLPQAGPNDEREYKCQIPGYVHDKPCTFKLDEAVCNDNAPPSKGGNAMTVALVVAVFVAILLGVTVGGYVYIRWFKNKVRSERYVEQLQEETGALEGGNEEARTLLATLKESRDALREEHTSLDSKKLELTEEIHTLREGTKTKDLIQEIAELKAEKEEVLKLKEDLEKAEQERQELNEEKEELMKIRKTQGYPLQGLQREVDDLKSKVEVTKRDLQTAKDTYSEQVTKLKGMDAEKRQLESDKAELDDMMTKNEKETKKMLEGYGGSLLKKYTRKKLLEELQELRQLLQTEKDRNGELQNTVPRTSRVSESSSSGYNSTVSLPQGNQGP